MEKPLIIKSADRKNIYAKLRGSLKKPVIVLVHGLGGHMDEALHYNASIYFEKRGFAVMRFNLYSWEKGARKLSDCTLKTHGQDIDTVIKYLQRRGVKKVFAIGHSYGAPSIMHAQHENLSGIVFWDGSYQTIKKYFKKLKYIPGLKGRIMDDGYSVIVGEAMVQEAVKINSKDLIRQVKVPIKFIYAGKGGLIRGGRAMHKAARKPKSFTLLPGATHSFNEDGIQEKLYAETVKWLKSFSK